MDELTEAVRTEFSRTQFVKQPNLGTLMTWVAESFYPLVKKTYEGNYHKNLGSN